MSRTRAGQPGAAPEAPAPEISVIVPVYNVSSHVGACLASLKAQSFADFEVIVIDDGSSDGSGEVAARSIAADPRFRLVRQPNAGLAAARNAGLALARGSYIGFVDSDDRVAPDYMARLHGALAPSSAEWVACAIRFVGADGTARSHPGVHGAHDMTGFSGLSRVDLDDWREVIRIFPSVWNKLYRRRLIEGLRFDEGLNYEDHAFYWRAAARTDHMLYLAEPLYVSTQGRPGQITRDGSERVFEQFEVLEILRGILAGEGRGKRGAQAAFAEIAARLTFERCVAIADPARRARFIARAQALLQEGPVSAAQAERLGVPASWIDRMSGRLPVSVVIPTDGNPGPLRETLQSLSCQHLRDFETVVVLDGTPGKLPGSQPAPLIETSQGLEAPPPVPARAEIYALAAALPGTSVILAGEGGVAAARNRGLDVARGGAVLFLDAGDRLPPPALEAWLNRLRRSGADLGFAGMVLGNDTGHPHSGLHEAELRPGMAAGTGPMSERDDAGRREAEGPGDEARRGRDPEDAAPAWGPPPPPGEASAGLPPEAEDALRIHAHPSAKLFDRAFLLRHGLRFAPEPLSSWSFLAASLSKAERIVALGPARVQIALRAETRQLWREPVAAAALSEAARRAAADAGLGQGAAARLFVRAVWEKANFAAFGADAPRDDFLAAAREELARLAPDGVAALDPYIGPWLRQRLGLA